MVVYEGPSKHSPAVFPSISFSPSCCTGRTWWTCECTLFLYSGLMSRMWVWDAQRGQDCTGFSWEFSTYFPSLCRYRWRVAQTLKVEKKIVPTCKWRSPGSPLCQIKLLPASSEREMSDGCSLGMVSFLSFPSTTQMPDMGALRAVVSPVFLHCCCQYFNLSLNLWLAAKGAVMCSEDGEID